MVFVVKVCFCAKQNHGELLREKNVLKLESLTATCIAGLPRVRIINFCRRRVLPLRGWWWLWGNSRSDSVTLLNKEFYLVNRVLLMCSLLGHVCRRNFHTRKDETGCVFLSRAGRRKRELRYAVFFCFLGKGQQAKLEWSVVCRIIIPPFFVEMTHLLIDTAL